MYREGAEYLMCLSALCHLVLVQYSKDASDQEFSLLARVRWYRIHEGYPVPIILTHLVLLPRWTIRIWVAEYPEL